MHVRLLALMHINRQCDVWHNYMSMLGFLQLPGGICHSAWNLHFDLPFIPPTSFVFVCFFFLSLFTLCVLWKPQFWFAWKLLHSQCCAASLERVAYIYSVHFKSAHVMISKTFNAKKWKQIRSECGQEQSCFLELICNLIFLYAWAAKAAKPCRDCVCRQPTKLNIPKTQRNRKLWKTDTN